MSHRSVQRLTSSTTNLNAITDQTDHRTILHELLHSQKLSQTSWQIGDGSNRNCYDVGCVEGLVKAGVTGPSPPWTVAAAYEFYAYAVRASKCVHPRGSLHKWYRV